MTQPNFTKGEWDASHGFVPGGLTGKGYVPLFVHTNSGTFLLANVLPRFGNEKNAEADARLISAAPDMYEALKGIIDSCHSHIDGRFLFKELEGRNTLDIKMRRDGKETWHEADWLTELGSNISMAKAALKKAEGGL